MMSVTDDMMADRRARPWSTQDFMMWQETLYVSYGCHVLRGGAEGRFGDILMADFVGRFDSAE